MYSLDPCAEMSSSTSCPSFRRTYNNVDISRTLMKKIFIAVVVLIFLTTASLFLTTKVSTAHREAKAYILRSSQTLGLGPVRHVLLTGFEQSRGPTGKGCTWANYLVIGGHDNKRLKVLVTTEGYKYRWVAVEIVASGHEFDASCTPG